MAITPKMSRISKPNPQAISAQEDFVGSFADSKRAKKPKPLLNPANQVHQSNHKPAPETEVVGLVGRIVVDRHVVTPFLVVCLCQSETNNPV